MRTRERHPLFYNTGASVIFIHATRTNHGIIDGVSRESRKKEEF